jgi:hypothetical protein
MRRPIGNSLAVAAGYVGISFLYFGWQVLPHPGRALVGSHVQGDQEIFIWSFAWWPHAVLHWTNPFFSHDVYAPTGINLAWVTSVPGLAAVFSPVTLVFGPSVSYNVAAILLPAVSAWTAFLLLRYVTGSTWAGAVGGYLYGFSTAVIAHELGGHLNLTAAFLVPLVPLVLIRYLREQLSGLGLAWRLGAIVAFQAYVSTEVAVTLTIVLLGALLVALAFVPEHRRRLVAALVPVAGGYAIAGLLAAPLVYYAYTGLTPAEFANPDAFSTDLLNFVLPTQATAWGGESFTSTVAGFPGNINERDAYLGLPLVLMALLYLVRGRWTSGKSFLLASFLFAALLSLGVALYVDGRRLFWLPWAAVAHLSGLKSAIPSRFAFYATLAAATMSALWMARTRGRIFKRPYVLPMLAVAALAPPFWRAGEVVHPKRLAFFTTGAYRTCIPRGENLVIFPFANRGDSLLWQAETGFRFRMSEGALGPTNLPESFVSNPAIGDLLWYDLPGYSLPTIPELRGMIRERRVDRVVARVSEAPDAYPTPSVLRALGKPELVDDVNVSPGCLQPSLQGARR